MNTESLAKKIADAIFKAGDEPGSPCQRIQFKGGEYPGKEKNQGGFCKDALIKHIQKVLVKELP